MCAYWNFILQRFSGVGDLLARWEGGSEGGNENRFECVVGFQNIQLGMEGCLLRFTSAKGPTLVG